MPFHIVDGAAVKDCLSLEDLIDLMADAQIALGRNRAIVPQRVVFDLPNKLGTVGAMPGAILEPAAMTGAKLFTLLPGNPDKGRPAVHAAILLFDAETGAPAAIVDATELTAMRTAAASAMATRALARDDASSLGLFGCGALAATHLDAIAAIRSLKHAYVWGRNTEKAEAFAREHSDRLGFQVDAVAAPDEAAQADIICAVTGSPEPVLKGEWLKLGTHINLVGAHSADTREADTDAVKRSKVFVESLASALNEAGDLLIPIKEGAISQSHIVGEIADVLTDAKPGRANNKDITLYKSLGNTAQDLAAASAAVARAIAAGRAQAVEFG